MPDFLSLGCCGERRQLARWAWPSRSRENAATSGRNPATACSGDITSTPLVRVCSTIILQVAEGNRSLSSSSFFPTHSSPSPRLACILHHHNCTKITATEKSIKVVLHKVSMEKHSDGDGRRTSVTSHILADPEDKAVSLDEAVPFDQQTTKNLLRKLDYHLVPFLALLYL